jgi:hypothetical protein
MIPSLSAWYLHWWDLTLRANNVIFLWKKCIWHSTSRLDVTDVTAIQRTIGLPGFSVTPVWFTQNSVCRIFHSGWERQTLIQGCGQVFFPRHSPVWRVVKHFHSPNQKTTIDRMKKNQWDEEKHSPGRRVSFYLYSLSINFLAFGDLASCRNFRTHSNPKGEQRQCEMKQG